MICGIEELKKEAGTCCCLDWNQAIGQNLEEKLQIVYVTMRRMQYITRKVTKNLPNVIVVQPMVCAMFESIKALKKVSVIDNELDMVVTKKYKHIPYDYMGQLWGMWDVFVEEEAWMEHHILMTHMEHGETLSENPAMWCKISLLNLVMSNNFGYFNMCM